MIAIDGKSARGAGGPKGRAVHLLAAFDQANGIVLGQGVVDGKTNEITAFAPLLDRIDITGAIITADALHTQHRHADYLIGRGAHYVLTVKRNQPSLHRQLRALPWAQTPAVDVTRDKGHGRVESRTLKLAAVTAGIGFPHARLAIQLIRRRRTLTNHKWHTETVYAITDLTCNQIRANQIAEAIRGHWGIENRLHWIRDVVFAEDHSQIRTRNAPAVMATLRNLAVSLHRLTGATNIAAACRYSHNSEINFAETLGADGVGGDGRCRSCTAPGAGSRTIEHVGSAHDELELEALKAAARQRLAGGQAELDLGLDAAIDGGRRLGGVGGPLEIASSRMGQLWDGLRARLRRSSGSTRPPAGTRCSGSWCWRGSSSRPASWTACGCWPRSGSTRSSYRHPQAAPARLRRRRVPAQAGRGLRGARRAGAGVAGALRRVHALLRDRHR